eukprot:Em0007g1324a
MERILEEMRRLRDDVKASQEEAALQVARSSRRDPYTFKRKGNENQHAFNDDVEDKLVQVQAHLGRVEAGEEGTRSASALAKAKEAVKEGRQLIARRQKLLKLADRSEFGWAVVEEYIDDDLAEDSDDEKRIERAELAAERKIVKKRRMEEKGAEKADGMVQRVARGQPRAPVERPRGAVPAVREERPAGFSGICFQCGELRHLRRDCPKRLPVATAYPLRELDGHKVHVGLGGDSWNVSPGGVDDCMQRCWEVQSPALADRFSCLLVLSSIVLYYLVLLCDTGCVHSGRCT